MIAEEVKQPHSEFYENDSPFNSMRVDKAKEPYKDTERNEGIEGIENFIATSKHSTNTYRFEGGNIESQDSDPNLQDSIENSNPKNE